MKSTKLLGTLLVLLCATAAHAQMYKWVGADGKVTYSDVPPPRSAKQVETKSLPASAAGPSTAGLPYELAEAVKNSPVKLYTTAKCSPCDNARKLLNERGVPFTEKTVTTNQDVEQLRQLSGDSQLPILVVGRSKQSGFAADAWNSALSSAGYPASNQLPSNYRNGAVEPAAPKVEAATPQAQSEAPAQRFNDAPPPPAGNAPPGFRF